MKSKEVSFINKGLHAYRLKDSINSLELKFAENWEKDNNRELSRGVLAYLMGDGITPVDPTDRDREVAATIIQWLGSNVGQSFLNDLGFKKCSKSSTAKLT